MFSFYKNRYKFLLVSSAVLLVGFVTMFVFGLNLDIQFKGGSILNYSYSGEINTQEAERVIGTAINGVVTVQTTKDLAGEKQALVVNVAGDEALSVEQQTAMREALTEAFPDNAIAVGDVQVVAPFIGAELLRNGLLAIFIASVLIVAYVWIRFRTISGPSAGVFALLALLHDVLIAFFAFVIFGFPLNETVVAVVLSILGWSVNDTIVIYDRIRENANTHRNNQSLPDLVDRSIHQSLTRSINTSLAAFFAVMIAYIFATIYNIESIREFALPMAVGIIAGSYSTIFIATPFWAMWKTRGGISGYEN